MKRKAIILLIAILPLGGGTVGYMWWKQIGPFTAPASAAVAMLTAQAERGGLKMSVMSTGRVVANLDVDIKCKASGEIVRLGPTTQPTDTQPALTVADLPMFERGRGDMVPVGTQPADAVSERPKRDGATSRPNGAGSDGSTAKPRKWGSRPAGGSATSGPTSMPTSMAAGKLAFDVSRPVSKGDMLVELDPIDEQRNVERAKATLEASQAKLISAISNLALAERNLATDRLRAQAAQEYAKAKAADARNKADRVRQLMDKNLASKEEYETCQTTVAAADADYTAAKVRLDELKTQEEVALELKRQDVNLARTQVGSDKIAVSISEDRLADTKVTSPIDGVVSALNVQVGQIISSGVSNVGGGTTMMTISDLSQVFVLASVDESDIGKVREGLTVVVGADAYPGTRFRGEVVRIATRGVNNSNVVTFEVKIEVVSRNKKLLKPEMTTNVEIIAEERDDAVILPVESVTMKNGKRFVTVAKGAATEDREVQLGISDGTRYEIVSGIEAGETVSYKKGGADGKWNARQGQGNNPQRMMMMGGGGGGRGR
jgi:HlyD family secretion protein